MTERLHAKHDQTLLPFLAEALPNWSRKKLKERLRLGLVTVNGTAIRQHDHPVSAGDQLEIDDLSASGPEAPTGSAGPTAGPAGRAGREQSRAATHAGATKRSSGGRAAFTTLFIDDDLVAIDKPAGLLSVSSAREREKTALALVRASLGKNARLWPVNRLDRETSGVILFARSHEMREAIQADWTNAEKVYLAIVAGVVGVDEGVVDTALWEDRSLTVHTGPRPPSDARAARTRFAVQRRGRDRSLLEVRLDTGRKHQIRVHLASLGFPIVGDARYGVAGRTLGLHAMHLSVTHPRTGQRLELHADPPAAFTALLP